MQLASNIARRDTHMRKGRDAFVDFTFEEYAQLCDKLIPQFCTWYAYERAGLIEYVGANEWSITGYHYQKKPLLYFDFIPFDFDSDGGILESFENASKFIELLKSYEVPETHYTIWLSGSK